MIVSAVTAAISVAAVVSSARHLARLGRLRPAEPEAFEAAVKSGDEARVAKALDALFPDGWSPALSEVLRGNDMSASAVADLNETLGDVDREIRQGDRVPRSASRIALFSGAFGAIVELLPTVGAPRPAYAPAVTAVGFGIVGALIAGELARRARERVGDVRSEWDRVAAVFSRKLGAGRTESPPDPAATRSSRRPRARGR